MCTLGISGSSSTPSGSPPSTFTAPPLRTTPPTHTRLAMVGALGSVMSTCTMSPGVRVCVYACVCMHACVRACACVRVRAHVCVCGSPYQIDCIPRSQFEKYKNLSSMLIRMSVMRGGTLGSIQPSTCEQQSIHVPGIGTARH